MSYKCLENSVLKLNNYSIVPIRIKDRYDIMKWRNEQIYHLRQNGLLTKENQDSYFENVVSKLFNEERPFQILFSYLDGEKCIGYGGLVHINWADKNAEISFLMNTSLEKDFFIFHWRTFLRMIEKIAFIELNLHKIFTYAFDLRPKLYEALEGIGYEREAMLKEHCFFEGEFIDVIIHSKTSDRLYLRNAVVEDLDITYTWANHPNTRKYAFNQEFIPFEHHQNWYTTKINDKDCIYQLFEIAGEPVGAIRIDVNVQEGLISYLIAPNKTGKGYGKKILELVVQNVKNGRPEIKVLKGLVKYDNIASLKIFEKLGFERKDLNNGIFEYTLTINHEDRKL